jgi:hypothetical protein
VAYLLAVDRRAQPFQGGGKKEKAPWPKPRPDFPFTECRRHKRAGCQAKRLAGSQDGLKAKQHASGLSGPRPPVGAAKRVGRIYQQTFADTYSKSPSPSSTTGKPLWWPRISSIIESYRS